jgi:glycosyltransferase involved in cell wall biosynthesis
MRIILDLQSVQGPSRNRGIGRYSLQLSKALIQQAKNHEIYIALNAHPIESVAFIRETFDSLIPQNRIKVFEAPHAISWHDYKNYWRIKAAEKIREHFLASLAPDIVFISSLFEGWGDIPLSIGELNHNYLTVTTLYDLIPFIFREFYITNDEVCNFYFRKMQFLKKSDLLLTISHSALQEAVELLAFPQNRIVNCSVGVDAKFKPYPINEQDKVEILKGYGINQKFIFYIGGLEFRKNVVNLIEAYALLSAQLRKQFQLVIAVNTTETIATSYVKVFKSRFKLEADEILLLHYLPEEQLIFLYNTCSLFVFPSLHEGFGLPIIEAMACGAPVISSNTSSMPEATGCTEALFDPNNPQDIANKITEVLTNEYFLNFLKKHSKVHAGKFTWEATAEKALAALENLYANKKATRKAFFEMPHCKKKIAYVSSFPPEKSRIANYSTVLLPELACFFEITLISNQAHLDDSWLNANFQMKDVDWFTGYAHLFDLVLYHFGNSAEYDFLVPLLNSYPGIVVLHDFFLGNLFSGLKDNTLKHKNLIYHALYQSHGFPGLAFQQEKGQDATLHSFPCNFTIFKRALGIIVHSHHHLDLAKNWYGANITPKFQVVYPPCLSKKVTEAERQQAKQKLGFSANDFLICTFASLKSNTLNHRLLQACSHRLKSQKNTYLVFIGAIKDLNYYKFLKNLIKKYKLKKQVRFVGYATAMSFKNYLLSTNIAMQLRAPPDDASAVTLLNCLAYGIPTIANQHANMQDLSAEAFIKLHDSFTDSELAGAIDMLYHNLELRKRLSLQALNYVQQHHHPAKIGKQYHQALEYFAANTDCMEQNLIKLLAKTTQPFNEKDLLAAAAALAENRLAISLPQLLIDISAVKTLAEPNSRDYALLVALLNAQLADYRIEAINYDWETKRYYYDTSLITKMLNLTECTLQAQTVEVYPQDIILTFHIADHDITESHHLIEKWQAKGSKNYLIFSWPDLATQLNVIENNYASLANLKIFAEKADGFISIGKKNITQLFLWLDNNRISRKLALNIDFIELGDAEALVRLMKSLQHNRWSMTWPQIENTITADKNSRTLQSETCAY